MRTTTRCLVAALTLTLAGAGCTTTELQLSLLVPSDVPPDRVDLSRAHEGRTAEVTRDLDILLLFPVGSVSLDEMVAEATGGRDDVVLVDVEVRRRFWWAVLFGRVRRQMRAVVVPLPESTAAAAGALR